MMAEVVSRDPWAVRLNGMVHVARPVSGHRVQAFYQAIRGASPEAGMAALTDLLRWAFPLRLSYWWRGDPVRQLVRLPAEEQRTVLTDFFAHLAGTPPAPRRSPMSGTVLRR